MNLSAALPHPNSLVLSNRFSLFELSTQSLQLIETVWRIQNRDGTARDLFSGITIDDFCALVPACNGSFQCCTNDRVIGRLYDRGQLSDRVLSPFPLGNFIF